MELSDGRVVWGPVGRLISVAAAPRCGWRVEPGARQARGSDFVSVGRSHRLSPMNTAAVRHRFPYSVGSTCPYVVGEEQMRLTGWGRVESATTAQVNRGIMRSRAIAIPHRPRPAPIVHPSESKVLAGWRAVNSECSRSSGDRALSQPKGGGCYVSGIWMITVFRVAMVVYRLASESTGIDVFVGLGARPTR